VAPSYSSRQAGPLKRRLVVGVLLLVSLAMITVYFREAPSGGLHDFQSVAASAMRPFEIGAQRVSRPFRDAYGWVAGLFHAKSENERLRQELEDVRSQVILSAEARRENRRLRALLDYRRGDTFPQDFPRDRAVAASVMSNPAGEFEQKIIIAAGSSDGIRLYDAVVTGRGLVGHVSKVLRDQSRVTMLTDQESAVTARDVKTGAIGVLRHGEGSALILDRVPKEKRILENDIVVTAGRGQGRLGSFFPRNIPIGYVTSVGQTDVDLSKDVQIRPYVDFSDLDSVLVLVPKKR
jgi:rod shape-determining protein MreC